jgi:NADH-quinone oxidoreductase subunit A
MNPAEPQTVLLWPLLVYFACVIAVVVGMIGLSWFLGQRHMERSTGIPFESGMLPTGSARRRINVSFYMVAMFFVIFDLESIFLFAWAVAARPLGWTGFWEVVVFVVIMLAALAYLWGQGALDWGTRQARRASGKLFGIDSITVVKAGEGEQQRPGK